MKIVRFEFKDKMQSLQWKRAKKVMICRTMIYSQLPKFFKNSPDRQKNTNDKQNSQVSKILIKPRPIHLKTLREWKYFSFTRTTKSSVKLKLSIQGASEPNSRTLRKSSFLERMRSLWNIARKCNNEFMY
jgi:hypothetical protein